VTKSRCSTSGVFQLLVLPDLQGFIRCAPSTLPHLVLSTFVSTVGVAAGNTVANLIVSPSTTIIADVIANTNPSDPQARAAALAAALAAGDADLSLLTQTATALYNAQLAGQIDIAFSSGDSDAGGDGASDGGGTGDGGGTSGDAGDGGAFSPIAGAPCNFALTMNGPVLRKPTLADLLANGTVVRPDLQAIVPQVQAALAGRQAAIVAAFGRLFPNGLGRPISTTADATGVCFLSTPPNVRGFVRCTPPEAVNLALSRFEQARQIGQRLTGQSVRPDTTVFSLIVTNAIQANLDPVPLQNNLLAAVAPLQFLLPTHPNGNGQFTIVRNPQNAPLPDRRVALLAFAGIAIFDAMRLQRANLPSTATFTNALLDYFADATFAPPLAVLQSVVDAALNS
jgi:hypothetical protein